MYRGYSRVCWTDEYFESGGRGHNIYFTSKYRGQQRIFSIVISKAISTFRFKFGILGLFVILMSNTVKKLKIEHCSTNSVWFFPWSVEIYMHVVAMENTEM
jgi:hypothetical protein